MNQILKRPLDELGYGFVAPEHLPPGADEFYFRDRQRPAQTVYRKLNAREIEILVKNENAADDWSTIYVTERFNPKLVKNCQFYGVIRIGDLDNFYLEYHDLRLPVGLYNSTIVSCDIGSNVVIDNVRHLAHYIIGDETILLNIDEMLTTSYAKFGNGIVKEGEKPSVRIWLEVCNENGGRVVAPFQGMLPADAFLWAKYRDDTQLMERFLAMTDQAFDHRRGYYGQVGDRVILKDCRVLKDVKIGDDAYIKGANKLKNLTIDSTPDEPVQIGEGVEMVNGIVGRGCRVFYGVKAVRFILGQNSNLKYGARLINSILGDNSTISCCEVLNSLIFPGHEQHHNNSFLCAALVLGQSNMAAGVTAGSNHNSRANDGEIVAGRGFWPGLCTSLKHNCRFASFVLLVKGDYPRELHIMLPFSLVSDDESAGALVVMPAFWFMYNMYALARNSWKYSARDKRIDKRQKIEFDALAPDSVEEILHALELLELWTGKALLKQDGRLSDDTPREAMRNRGRDLLRRRPEAVAKLEVLGEDMENSRRPVHIVKTAQAWVAYREMAELYAVETLVKHMVAHNLPDHTALLDALGAPCRGRWINVGGQLMLEDDLNRLKDDVRYGAIATWDALHERYDELWARYPADKARHALGTLLALHEREADECDAPFWDASLQRAVATKNQVATRTYENRLKDYTDAFRKIPYESVAEMEAVLGPIEDNDFIAQIRSEAEAFSRTAQSLKASP